MILNFKFEKYTILVNGVIKNFKFKSKSYFRNLNLKNSMFIVVYTIFSHIFPVWKKQGILDFFK